MFSELIRVKCANAFRSSTRGWSCTKNYRFLCFPLLEQFVCLFLCALSLTSDQSEWSFMVWTWLSSRCLDSYCVDLLNMAAIIDEKPPPRLTLWSQIQSPFPLECRISKAYNERVLSITLSSKATKTECQYTASWICISTRWVDVSFYEIVIG